MQPSLSHLENIDPRFLDPNTALVVMCESTEADLDDVRLALEGLTAIFENAADMNAGLCRAGVSERTFALPPDGIAAILRLIAGKMHHTTGNPTLGAVQHIRPDLFARRPVGGL